MDRLYSGIFRTDSTPEYVRVEPKPECVTCFFHHTVACSYCKVRKPPKRKNSKRFDPIAGYEKLFGTNGSDTVV